MEDFHNTEKTDLCEFEFAYVCVVIRPDDSMCSRVNVAFTHNSKMADRLINKWNNTTTHRYRYFYWRVPLE